MKVELKTVTPEAEKTIVEIARVSSSRKNKSEDLVGLTNYLIRNKHWSPFEHASMTIEFETSKAIGIQLLRHRSFTFQEFSQRYAVVNKIEPIELRQQHKNNRQSSTEIFDPEVSSLINGYTDCKASAAINKFMAASQDLYNDLLEAGVARECARMVLPMATSTTIYMTGTIRSWIHFIQIRNDEHAQKEIRILAEEVQNIFKKEFPIISEALGF